MFSEMKQGYAELWKAIIRPPRDEYTIADLGQIEFKVKGIHVRRNDIDIKNKLGLTLKCSHFEPVQRPCKELPCVVYLHGNSSSRVESLACLPVLITQNITLFTFDFAGCGLSEGQYISLGWYEREDVETIMNYLRNTGTVSTIGLWGRSMGAVTALMHADRDPSIAGLVLDSAFSSLRQLAEDLCKQHKNLPSLVISAAMAMIKSTVESKAKFNINDLNPLKNHVSKAFVPALFVSGKQDTFIDCEHSKVLHKAYAGDKNLILVDGDHNSMRPQFMMDSVGIFFYNTLQVEYLVPKKPAVQQQQNKEEDSIFEMNLQQDGAGQNRKIGNHDKVEAALYRNFGNKFDDGEDEDDAYLQEQMRIAIAESEKESKKSNNGNSNSVANQNNPASNQNKQSYDDIFDLLEQNNGMADQSQKQQQQQEQQKKQEQQKEEIDWFGESDSATKPNNVEPNQNSQQKQQNSAQNQSNSLAEYFDDYS